LLRGSSKILFHEKQPNIPTSNYTTYEGWCHLKTMKNIGKTCFGSACTPG